MPHNPFQDGHTGSSRRKKSLLRLSAGLLHGRRREIERWVGARIQPPILGCGHWGCVTMTEDGARLVKITVDPAEPHVARVIHDLQREDSARGSMVRGGVVRIDKVAKVRGVTWSWRRRRHPVYAIVREAVIPVDENSSRCASDPIAAWLRRKRRRSSARSLLEEQLQQRMEDVRLGNETIVRPPGWMSGRTQDLLDSIVETLESADKRRSDRGRKAKEREALGKMAELASYPEGACLGEAMMALLAGAGIPLRDVHVGNVGLRIHPAFVGCPTPAFVLYDFGHAELRSVPQGLLDECP